VPWDPIACKWSDEKDYQKSTEISCMMLKRCKRCGISSYGVDGIDKEFGEIGISGKLIVGEYCRSCRGVLGRARPVWVLVDLKFMAILSNGGLPKLEKKSIDYWDRLELERLAKLGDGCYVTDKSEVWKYELDADILTSPFRWNTFTRIYSNWRRVWGRDTKVSDESYYGGYGYLGMDF
jgi:hypothetical protein